MTNKELAQQTRKALEKFGRLPPDEQVKILVEAGIINERGEVLMGGCPPSNVPAEVGKGQADQHTKKQSATGE